MNKIFKVIWNHTTQTWTAVGELASAKGKSKSVKLAAISTALLAVAGASQIAVASDKQVAENTGIVSTSAEAKNVSPTVKLDASQLGGMAISPDRVSDQFKGGAHNGTANIPGAKVYAHDGIAIGSGTEAGTKEVGGNGHVAIGLMARANGAKTGGAAVALGAYAVAEEQDTIAIGNQAHANGSQAVSIGHKAESTANGTVAVGNESQSNGFNSTAVGDGSQAVSNYSTALGGKSKAKGWDTIAVGYKATVDGDRSTGVGARSQLTGTDIASLGKESKISSNKVSTLGAGITVGEKRDGAVVLGYGSDADNTTVTQEDQAKVGDLTYSGFKGNLKNINKDLAGRFVSVGSENNERQIKHVAAGKIDSTSTDAINGSQLYAVASGLRDQFPVVYTDADGNKVVKYPDGKYYPEGTTFDANGNPSNPAVTNVIASMNNGDNKKDKPMQLANVGSNLPTVDDTTKQAFDPNSTTPKDGKDNKSAPITADEAAAIAKKAGNNAATVSDVLNAGWNLKNNGEARDFVKPYDTVNFVNGIGTTAVVETNDEASTSNVTFNVDMAEITPESDGSVKGPVPQELLDKLDAAQAKVDENPDDEEAKKALEAAQDAVNKAGGNKVANAQNVADMINSSGFTLKTSATADGKKESGDDEIINPGKTVEMVAGKNLTVKQEANGKVTYSMKDDVEFTSVKVGEDKDGKKPVNFTTEKATDASNNDPANKPTTALNVSSSDGKPTQITGVGSTLNVKPVDTNPNGTPTTGNLVDLVGTDAKPVNKNAAATVGDLQNMGWVVSSDKATDATGEYKDVVKNANEVKFVGKGAAKVSGKTVNGVRTITVDVEAPSVETAKITPNTDGSVTGPVAADKAKELADNLKKAEQAVKDLPADATEDKKAEAQKALKDAQDAAAPLNKVATAQNVAEAINNSGWRTNSTTATGGAKDTLINPGKAVNFESGKNMEVAQTVDKDGNVAYTYKTKDDVQFNSVQLGGDTGPKLTNDGNDLKVSGSNGTPVKITNVANGNISADSKDAVNGSQLHATNQSINRLGDTVNNIGGNVTRLSDKVDNMDRDYRAGIAGSNAAASLPQVYLPGKSMVAAAAGTFKGQNALAVGYSSISDNGKLIWKAQANLNSRADVGVGVGMGYLW